MGRRGESLWPLHTLRPPRKGPRYHVDVQGPHGHMKKLRGKLRARKNRRFRRRGKQ
jgi:hypothetical protein